MYMTSTTSPFLDGPNIVRDGDIFVLELACKLRTFDVCSSGERLDTCSVGMLRGRPGSSVRGTRQQ